MHNSRIEQAGSICKKEGEKQSINFISEIRFQLTSLDVSAQAIPKQTGNSNTQAIVNINLGDG